MRKDPGFFILYSFCVLIACLFVWKIASHFYMGEVVQAIVGLPILAIVVFLITWYTSKYNAQAAEESDEDSHVF